MTWAYETFGSGLVVTSSMVDTVMIHLAEQVAPGMDVIFLDTGYHFVETIGTRDAATLVHNVNVINVTPEQTVAEPDAAWGKDLFARDPDQCCNLRKVQPLGRALQPYAAWASGISRVRLRGPGPYACGVLGRQAQGGPSTRRSWRGPTTIWPAMSSSTA